MKQRCYNPKNKKFHLYGGRGIAVCDRWRTDFWAFAEDMGERPDGHTIDRYPDQSGDYCPENCRWATSTEQRENTRPPRDARYMTLNGITKQQAEWARTLGISVKTIASRRKYGWSDEEILTIPAGPVGTNSR